MKLDRLKAFALGRAEKMAVLDAFLKLSRTVHLISWHVGRTKVLTVRRYGCISTKLVTLDCIL